MSNRHKKWYCWIAVSIIVLIGAELILRFVFGFCDALLYRSSDRYEYIAQPGQNRHRFGAYIHYNSYSQRSEEPDSTKDIVLGLGDSVIFGGTWMDQDSLATTLFSKETGLQMLNIACGSWGPDNCAAYLEEKGTFGAKAMILVCSSHDAYDVMSHQPVVGIYPNYPDRQYRLALCELMERYILPRAKRYFVKKKQALDPDAQVIANTGNMQVARKSRQFNHGFDELKHLADSAGIPFAIYLHAEKGELAGNRYNDMGQEIIRWAEENDVLLMQGIETERDDMYHDAIHLNEQGQRHLADCMKRLYEVIYQKDQCP